MDLLKWMENNHVVLSPYVTIKPSSFGGTGVFAEKDFAVDEILLTTPKAVVLSPKTCGISNLLDEVEFDPMQALTLAFIFEKNQPKSPWAAFIASILTTPVPDVPRLWSQDEKEMLGHCDIAFTGGLDIDQFEQGYEEAAEFLDENLAYDLTIEEYTDSILRVSSRAFDVDNFHELALVPGACLFNHTDSNNVRFESDGTVCDLCGKLACGCQFSDDEDDEEEEADEDEEEQQEDKDDDTRSDISVDLGNVCEIRAISPLANGEEIFNTYGEDGNNAMLGRYGFVIPQNKHEVLDLTRDIFQFAKRNNLKDRYSYWKKHLAEFVQQEDIDSHDVLYVDADGQLSDQVVFIASILSLGEKEYAKFKKTGTYNLKNEQTVRKTLKAVLTSRYINYRDGDRTSAEYFELANQSDGRLAMIYTVIGTEKLVIEKAILDVGE